MHYLSPRTKTHLGQAQTDGMESKMELKLTTPSLAGES